MEKKNSTFGWRLNNLRHLTLLLVILTAAVFGILFIKRAQAALPTGGAVSPTAGSTVTWQGTGIAPGGGLPQDEPTSCVEGTNCDTFNLTVNGTPVDWQTSGGRIRVRLSWQLPTTDYDMVVRKESGAETGLQTTGANTDPVIGTSGGSTNEEEVILDPGNQGVGLYYVRALYFAGTGPAQQYSGSAQFFTVPVGLPPSGCAVPTYDNYQPPSPQFDPQNGDDAGEPSVGVNWNTGNILAQARLYTFRATFNDSTSPASPTMGVSWLAKKTPATVTGLDPILFTDPITGRTFGGELAADGHTIGGITDDDLSNFTQAVFGGGVTQGFDHQTVGGGPPKLSVLGRQPTGSYPHLVYYASQQIGYASIATSFDGGVTWGQDIPMWNLLQCTGIHGHVKVAPDGTVYVPNRNCNNKVAVAVSEDNGLNWSIRQIPTSSSESDDPSIGIGAGGRLYVAYTAADKKPHVAVSDDKGLTWRDDFDLSNSPIFAGAMKASVFPSAVAGDNNRAAVFFLATNSPDTHDPTGTDGAPTTGPDPDLTDNFEGTWYPYIATTCDGGRSWTVVRADNDPLRPGLPNPVQQGVVCKNGTTCPGGPPDTRNLLDFNDIAVDSRGRIIAAYADGCITNTCISLPEHSVAKEGNDGAATLTIIRQRGGMRLFGAFDPNGPAPPPSPPVEVREIKRGNLVSWSTPYDGGSPLTGYRIYRGISGRGDELIAEVKTDVYTFSDLMKRRDSRYYYRVTAVNAYGESPRNLKVFPGKGAVQSKAE